MNRIYIKKIYNIHKENNIYTYNIQQQYNIQYNVQQVNKKI